MAAKRPTGPTPVDAVTHNDKRVNIPSAPAEEWLDSASREPIPLLYPRDTTLDPQLVWKGKDAQDAEDLLVEAPPLYIQEKLDPRVLIENLRRASARPDAEPELSLFDTFDGLEGMQSVEFYQHAANWSNRLILGDSLQVMGSLAEREQLRGHVQMIYLDPPYGIKFGSNPGLSVGLDSERGCSRNQDFVVRAALRAGAGSGVSVVRRGAVRGGGGAGCQAGSGMVRRRVNALARARAQGQCSARRRNTLRCPRVIRAAVCSSR